jgi:tRNA pseudouridine55 synthase
MFGLLNLDKSAGLTSRDVVNRVQRLVKPHKVGHAGTLDPLATGVLVVAVGPATRLVEYVQRMEKTYRGTFLVGRTSDTEDVAGNVVELAGAPAPNEEQIREALPQFIGTTWQRPPAFSALKVAGQRAYELARRGDAVELAPRPVEIHAIEILRYAYPELELRIRCGSGTYIRSLGRDLARALGTDAVMSALRREAIGPFQASEAMPIDELSFEAIQHKLLPAALAVSDLPRIAANDAESARLALGQSIGNRFGVSAPEIAALDSTDTLAAILVPADGQSLRPTKCFLSAASAR